ncbi:MAG: protein phosphatase 2C domain-containing protein [Pseudomonadota bacterium]|nr:protein phosphatase 2C domain-containing protein [Pseudomonadota bacterium]
MLTLLRSLQWQMDGDSQTGPVREHNEDCFAIHADKKRSFAIVCDGVGGHNAGEVASQMACAFLSEQLRAMAGIDEGALKHLLHLAHTTLCDAAEEDAALSQMATTVVLAVQQGNRAWIAWAGDSRAYCLRGNKLTALTQDHSFVAEKIAQGVLSVEEATDHPMASTITSSLGGKRGALRHRGVCKVKLKRGDRLVLMSDGVYGSLSEVEVIEAASQGARKLTMAAIENGSADNASAVVVEVV